MNTKCYLSNMSKTCYTTRGRDSLAKFCEISIRFVTLTPEFEYPGTRPIGVIVTFNFEQIKLVTYSFHYANSLTLHRNRILNSIELWTSELRWKSS